MAANHVEWSFRVNSSRTDEHAIRRDMCADEYGSWETPMNSISCMPKSCVAFIMSLGGGSEYKALPGPNNEEIVAWVKRGS